MRDDGGPSASLAATRAQLNYRPLRRLYSIPAGDRASARDVIRFATKIWGGVHDLIGLEREDGLWDGFTRYCAEAVDPDMAIVAGGNGDSQVARGQRLSGTLAYEVITVRRHFWSPHAQRPTLILPSGVIPYSAPGTATLWEAAAWGDESPSLFEQQTDALGELSGNEVPVAQATPWAMPAGRIMRSVMLGETALDATAAGVSVRHGTALFRFPWLLVPILAPDDLEGIVLFWNVRAVYAPHQVRVVPWPLWADEDTLAPARELIRMGFADDMHSTEPDVFVCCFDREAVAATRGAMPRLFELAEYTGGQLRSFWPPRRRESPPTVAYSVPPLPAFQRLSAGLSAEYPVQIGDDLRMQLAPPDSVARSSGSIALDLVDFSPLAMPRWPELAQLAHPNARATAAGLSWTGWFPRSEWSVHVPTDRRIFEALAARAGLQMSPSPWGEAAQRTLRLVGGLAGVSVLQDDVALRVLDTLADHREGGSGRPRPDEKTAIAMAEISSRIWPEDSRKGKKAVGPALDRLVQAGLVFAGVRTTCEACGTGEWRIIDDVRSEMVCRGCRALLPLRLKSVRYDHLEPTWEYRENQLLVWPVSQGVLPGLMALKVLAGSAQHRFRFLLGQSLAGVGEIDALLTIDREVGVLEVKAGADLNEAEVERTLDVAQRLRARAIFATQAVEWTAQTLTRLHGAAEAARTADVPFRVQSLTRGHLLGMVAVPPTPDFGGIAESHVTPSPIGKA